MLDKLFKGFLREKQYLQNVSVNTVKYLGWVFNRWQALIGEFPNKQNTKEFVIELNESNLSRFTINSYIRGTNTFYPGCTKMNICRKD